MRCSPIAGSEKERENVFIKYKQCVLSAEGVSNDTPKITPLFFFRAAKKMFPSSPPASGGFVKQESELTNRGRWVEKERACSECLEGTP